MGTCLFVIALALLWLFRESDWLRLRMVVGSTRDYYREAAILIAQHEAEATNATGRAVVDAERDILSLIDNATCADDVLEWTRYEISRIEKEFGDRLCPYRNSSRRGHKGGHANNPYAYPYYGVTGAELDAKYATYLKFETDLACRMELSV